MYIIMHYCKVYVQFHLFPFCMVGKIKGQNLQLGELTYVLTDYSVDLATHN